MRHVTAGLGLLIILLMFLLVLMPLPVHAAATLVQSNDAGCFLCTSLPVSSLFHVTSGNVLVVGVTTSLGYTVSTIGDSLGLSFTQVGSTNSGQCSAYIFYAILPSGGVVDTVTANFNGANYATIHIYEVSGVVTTGATTGQNIGTVSSVISTSPVTFQGGAFLLGVIGANNAGLSLTHGAGFTLSPSVGFGTGYTEYSTSVMSSPTNFQVTDTLSVVWAEVGIALNPPASPSPIPEYPLGLPILAILMIIGYGVVRRRSRN